MKSILKALPATVIVFILIATTQIASAFYDPSSQRWLNRDPIAEAGGINLYQFVYNSPAALVDSDGRIVPLLIAVAVTYFGYEAIVNAPGPSDPGAGPYSDSPSPLAVALTAVNPAIGIQAEAWSATATEFYRDTGLPLPAVGGLGSPAGSRPPCPRTAPRTGANTTRLGIARQNPADWRATRDLWDRTGYGEILSDANRAAIARSETPVVDDTWVRFFPEDAGLLGELIPMHHIQGTPITVPLPATRHLDAHMPGGFRYNPGGPGSALPVYPPKTGGN